MISPHQIISTAMKSLLPGLWSLYRARLSTRYMGMPQNTPRKISVPISGGFRAVLSLFAGQPLGEQQLRQALPGAAENVGALLGSRHASEGSSHSRQTTRQSPSLRDHFSSMKTRGAPATPTWSPPPGRAGWSCAVGS